MINIGTQQPIMNEIIIFLIILSFVIRAFKIYNKITKGTKNDKHLIIAPSMFMERIAVIKAQTKYTANIPINLLRGDFRIYELITKAANRKITESFGNEKCPP